MNMDDSDSDEEGNSTHLRWMGPTLGDQFPDLRGETQDTTRFSLHEYLGNSWGIVFMHPADFTPVCTTEIGAAQSLIEEFEVRNIKMCGFSCDDSTKHRAWIDDIRVATGQRITFPLFCDPTRMNAIELGVFDPALKDADGLALTARSVFVINRKKEIALTMTYPASVGRNFDEILRVVDALQRVERFGVTTPANWNPGDKTIVSCDMDDEEAARRFGKNGYTTVDLPSESGKQPNKHYLRYTDDPILTASGKQSFKLAVRMTKPKLSWRPPKSFALTLFLPGMKRGQGSDTTPRNKYNESPAFTPNNGIEPKRYRSTNDLTQDISNASRIIDPINEPIQDDRRTSIALFLPGMKRGQASDTTPRNKCNESPAFTPNNGIEPKKYRSTNDLTQDISNASRNIEPMNEPIQDDRRTSIDYSNHRPWKMLLRPFSNKKSETRAKVECPHNNMVVTNNNGAEYIEEDARSGELLVDFRRRGSDTI